MATFLRQRVVVGFAGGNQCLMTYYWDSTGAAQSLLATEGMARVRAMWASVSAFHPVNLIVSYNPVFDEIEETNGNLVGQVAGTPPAANTFSGATDTLPFQTQGLARYSTNTFLAGRRLQGRQFLPFPLEVSNDPGGTPASGYRSGWQTALNLLGTTVVTPMAQRIWHRPTPSSAGLSSVVIARTVGTSWAVLKSRR